jgi:hypothetical protein
MSVLDSAIRPHTELVSYYVYVYVYVYVYSAQGSDQKEEILKIAS